MSSGLWESRVELLSSSATSPPARHASETDEVQLEAHAVHWRLSSYLVITNSYLLVIY